MDDLSFTLPRAIFEVSDGIASMLDLPQEDLANIIAKFAFKAPEADRYDLVHDLYIQAAKYRPANLYIFHNFVKGHYANFWKRMKHRAHRSMEAENIGENFTGDIDHPTAKSRFEIQRELSSMREGLPGDNLAIELSTDNESVMVYTTITDSFENALCSGLDASAIWETLSEQGKEAVATVLRGHAQSPRNRKRLSRIRSNPGFNVALADLAANN